MKKHLPLLLALTVFAPLLQAGKIDTKAIPNKGIFGIKVAGTDQEFYGRSDLVSSISFQEYTTGTFIVSEVTVDMIGSGQLLRIYSTRVPGLSDAQDEAEHLRQSAGILSNTGSLTTPSLPTLPSPVTKADQAAQDASRHATSGLVVKVWPVTTHAKTVEFSVSSKTELQMFHSSFRDLLAGRPVQVKQDSVVLTAAEKSSGDSQSGLTTVSQIGGTLFTIE